MSYLSIPSTWIEAGKALKKRILVRVSNNLEDHESRINNIESGISKVEVFNFEVMGFINNYTASELVQIGTHKASIGFSITEVKIVLLNGSSSPATSSVGVLEIDIEKSLDNGQSWSSILTTRPTIADGINSTGSESGVVEFISGEEIINQNELLRVNVTSKKDVQGSFLIHVFGEVS